MMKSNGMEGEEGSDEEATSLFTSVERCVRRQEWGTM